MVLELVQRRRVLITGGAGFIGSHLVRRLLRKTNWLIINYDKLTYCGNLANLVDCENSSNYRFVEGDICDPRLLGETFKEFDIDCVIHLAAESHVDRSISDPGSFVQTNINGTCALLEAALASWGEHPCNRTFLHVSTDEVFGSLDDSSPASCESTLYRPRSPYAASKASADLMVQSFHETFGLPTIITNCSNNYGPYQFPEKLIPVVINKAIALEPIPVYGKGLNIRDWIYVEDHASALEMVFERGSRGSRYNIGANSEVRNLELVESICGIVDDLLGRRPDTAKGLIQFVEDRKGHDYRYAIDNQKIQRELGWNPTTPLSEGLRGTVLWYLANGSWLEEAKTRLDRAPL